MFVLCSIGQLQEMKSVASATDIIEGCMHKLDFANIDDHYWMRIFFVIA